MSIKIFLFGIYFLTGVSLSEVPKLRITQISLFRSEVQLEKASSMKLEIGSKILAKSYTEHKCLLVVSRISGNRITADAALCPGFGSLKKGDPAELASEQEKNDEVRIMNDRDLFS